MHGDRDWGPYDSGAWHGDGAALERKVSDLEKRVQALEAALAKKAFNTYGLLWPTGEFMTQEQADYMVASGRYEP